MVNERKERRTCRDSKHNRDMLADANYTILKFEHLQQHQQRKHQSLFKKKLGNNVKSIFGQRINGKTHKTLKIVENNVDNEDKEFKTEFYNRLNSRKYLEMNKLNSRIEQLKKRILPCQMEEGKKIEFKLNEIIDINNNQSKNLMKSFNYFSEKNSPNSKYVKKLPQQTDYKEAQRNFWKKLSQEIKLKTSTVNLIRSNRVNLLIRKSMDFEEDLQNLIQIKSLYRKKDSSSLNTSLSASFAHQKLTDNELRNEINTTVNSSFNLETETSKRINEINKNNELAEWEMIRYLKQKEKRKKFVNSISKELIQNEKAVKIYSLVKGGYPLDQSEVEGEFISLGRFNEARSEFATLNWMYKTVKQDVISKNIINQQLQKQNLNYSFKRLVQINELSQKIPKNQLQKLMKTSKIVI